MPAGSEHVGLVPMIINWYVGWILLLTAFISGAAIGLGFHHEQFLGGYNSFRRRLLRLGHIAQAALGMLNVLFSIAVMPDDTPRGYAASFGWMMGGISMPLVCFLAAWWKPLRHLFFIPVTALLTAVILTLIIGPR
ncbi:MAG: hypothetical protein KDB03_00885 [Planctomycetales bacterium]|nr:hypothetical protein [Planctomycetales bacterium]